MVLNQRRKPVLIMSVTTIFYFKIGSHNILSSSKGKTTNVLGYRFIDLEILNEFVTHEVCCKLCGESSLVLEDNEHGRKGCVSHLRAQCISCGWAYTFHTSKKQGYAFDANNRFVYAMRSLGKGHTAAKRFCALMNMPPPQPTAYRAWNIALAKAAKTVAVKTMKDAANRIGNNQLKEVNQCAVSCDGTWQRREHSSMNGCVTISMENEKCLDVEVLSKVFHGCRRIGRENDHIKRAFKQQKHVGKCKINHTGSSAAMETEGVMRIFQRSENERNLQYTEYFRDGNSKAYAEVKLEEGTLYKPGAF